MRSLIYGLLSLATFATARAVDTTTTKSTDDWDAAVPDTVFNGETVPPMKELTSEDIEKEVSRGVW